MIPEGNPRSMIFCNPGSPHDRNVHGPRFAVEKIMPHQVYIVSGVFLSRSDNASILFLYCFCRVSEMFLHWFQNVCALFLPCFSHVSKVVLRCLVRVSILILRCLYTASILFLSCFYTVSTCPMKWLLSIRTALVCCLYTDCLRGELNRGPKKACVTATAQLVP